MRPLCIDLFCGLGGWSEGFLAEGYECIGFDIERHDYGTGVYPGQLVLQDVLTLHGSQFRDAAVIVASPPCQAYSYRAMPWKRAKALPPPDNTLFEACFRIQRESGGVPLVVENVKGAQPWVGRARWHYGSFYLWGDVPALMPFSRHKKVPGFNFHAHEKGITGGSFQSAAVEGLKWGDCNGKRFDQRPRGSVAAHREGTKNNGGSWFAIGSPGQKNVGKNPDGRRIDPHAIEGSDGGPLPAGSPYSISGELYVDIGAGALGAVIPGSTVDSFGWSKDTALRDCNSKSPRRKAASAQIAKIPLPLSRWIAKTYKPGPETDPAFAVPHSAGRPNHDTGGIER